MSYQIKVSFAEKAKGVMGCAIMLLAIVEQLMHFTAKLPVGAANFRPISAPWTNTHKSFDQPLKRL